MNPDKRKKILKAAITVFARNGFLQAKVEEIASLAGVATGTTYLYFENKDDILISIFEEEMNPIIKTVTEEMEKQQNPVDQLTAFITQHMIMVQENPDMAYLLQVELRQSSKFIRGYSGTKFKEYLNLIAIAFKNGQQQNLFRNDISVTIFKQMLFGALDQISTNWILSKSKNLDLEQSAKQISDVFFKGILTEGE